MSYFDRLLDGAVNKIAQNEILCKKIKDGFTFVEEMVNSATGKNVFYTGPNVWVDGVDVTNEAKRKGETVGKKINAMANILTPDEWKHVGALMYKVASFNIPALAVIDWNYIAEVTDKLSYKSVEDFVTEDIDWRGIATTLITQKATRYGVPAGVVRQIVDYSNKVLLGEGQDVVAYTEEDLDAECSEGNLPNAKAMVEGEKIDERSDIDSMDAINIYVEGYNRKEATSRAKAVTFAMDHSQILTVAENMEKNQMYDDAFEMYRLLAKDGDGSAMYRLANYFKHGIGNVKFNRNLGEIWTEKGYEAGDKLCELSKKISQTEKDTIEEITTMADAGNIYAEDELGCYLYQNTSMKDRGIDFVRKAAENGYPIAMSDYGAILVIEGSKEDGLKWIMNAYQKKCNNENTAFLGKCIYEDQNKELGAKIIKDGVAHGCERAMRYMKEFGI